MSIYVFIYVDNVYIHIIYAYACRPVYVYTYVLYIYKLQIKSYRPLYKSHRQINYMVIRRAGFQKQKVMRHFLVLA